VLILLPVFLPILSAVAILILQRTQPRFGISYLVAVLVSLANWGLILAFHWINPPPLALPEWLPIPGLPGAIIFQLDTVSWSYSFAIAGLAAAVILTASARLALRSIPSAWAGSLLVSGAAILAIIASSPLALALAWMIIDLIELAVILWTVNQPQMSLQAVLSFSARVSGTFFLIIAMAVSQSNGQVLILIAPPQASAVFLLIAAGLRLGVLPLHLPYSAEVPLRRGLGTILRLASPASSLVLLAHLPPNVVPPEYSPFLLIFSALAGLYGAAMWAGSADEISGRPYWMIALAGLCVASSIRGYPQSTLAWGIALVLTGGVLFLYTARERLTGFPLAISLLAFSGLPFTPAANGWKGLVIPPINAPDFIFLLAHALIMIGFIRHAQRPADPLSPMERWIQVLYPFGLYFLAANAWLLLLLGLPGTLTSGVWWASILSALLTLGYVVYFWRYRSRIPTERFERIWVVIIARRAGRLLSAVLRLDWLYIFLGALLRVFQSVLQGVTTILEGEGGVLWVFVLLALLLSLLAGQGSLP